jgi:hypothetical protein
MLGRHKCRKETKGEGKTKGVKVSKEESRKENN